MAKPPPLVTNPTGELPLDRALGLVASGDGEGALRSLVPLTKANLKAAGPLFVLGHQLRLLDQKEVAVQALETAADRAADSGNLPMALAAIAELIALGADVSARADDIAQRYGKGSAQLRSGSVSLPPLAQQDVQPMPGATSGSALIEAATQIVEYARAAQDADREGQKTPPAVPSQGLFSSLSASGLRALMSAFEVRILAKGEKVIEEGTPGAEAFVLARGELEVFRAQQGEPPLLLARLGSGVVFGEMALLSRSPRAASVVAARPCIVLIIRVEALDAVARKAPEVGTVIAGYCHRRMVANLVRTSSLLAALSAGERQALIERFAAKTFETGDKLVSQGKESDGLHVVASGSVSVVRNDGGEDVVITELGVGEVIGEVSLVFRRPSNADVVAAHPTMTLFLPRVRFREIVREHPTLLAQLYELASKRDDETASIVAEEASDATDLIDLTRPGSPGETSPDRGGALGRIVRNAASMLAGDAAGEILVVYALGLAALSLGPVGFGRLAESQAFMDPFDILGGLGLGNVAMVVAASRGGVDGALQGTILGMRTMSAVVTASLGLAAAFLTGRADSWRLLVAISVGMMLVPVSIVSVLPFRYEQALHRRMVVPFLVSVVRLSCAYLAYWFMREPLGFQLAVLGATAAAAALDYHWARRFYPERPRFDWGLARRLLAMGWPAAVFEVTVAIYSRASYFLLRGSGAVAQGEYAAADRLVKPLLSVATALYVSALPAIAALAAEGRVERLRVTYRQAVVRVFAFALPVAVPFWFLAALLLRRFAPAYTGSIWPFRTLLVGAFFMFLNTLSTAFILALGRFRVIMMIVLVDLGVYLTLAMHLIPKYGSLGAALSTSTMESVNACMQTPLVFFLLRASGQRQRQH